MRDLCTILRRKADKAKEKYDEISKKEDSYKEQLAKSNLMYEEIVLRMRVVQARLETLQPPLLKENVIISPPTMIKNIRVRHEAKRELKKSKIVDYFETTDKNEPTCTVKGEDAKKSKRTKQISSKDKGKQVTEEAIMIDDDTDDKEVPVDPICKRKKLNLHRMKISNYIPVDVKSRLEAFWDKTSQQ